MLPKVIRDDMPKRRKTGRMNPLELGERIKELKPGTRGFKQRAARPLNKLFRERFGLKDDKHRRQVVHQAMDRMNTGKTLYEAVREVSVPLSLDPEKLKYYGNIEHDWIGEWIELVRFSKDGTVRKHPLSLDRDYSPNSLRKEIVEYMDTEAGPDHGNEIERCMARALASLACEGVETSYGSLAKNYLNVKKIPMRSRWRMHKWLKTAGYDRHFKKKK